MGRTKTLKEFAVKTKGKHSNRNRQSDNEGYYDLFVKSFYWLLLHQFSTNPSHESMLQDNVNYTR